MPLHLYTREPVYPVDDAFIMTDYEVRKQILTRDVFSVTESIGSIRG
jgi:hypothetical protein